MSGRWYRESCWNGGKKKKRQRNMRNMHGVGFPNATYWVCTQTGTNADLQREPSQLVQRDAFDQTHGAFSLVKSKALHEEQGLHIWDAAYTDTSLQSQERVSTTHHNLYPQFGVQSRNVNSSTFCLFCPFVSVRPSVTAGLCLPGTCTRRWTPPSFSGPISRSQSKCKCPKGTAEW